MAVDPAVRIDIAAQFTGAKAFKKAQKSTFDLERNVKNLGKSLGLTLSTTAVLAFAKASIKAFAEEEKAVRSLSRTLKNLGFTYSAQTGAVDNYIQTLSAATGVFDDELRPAMETFLRATGSITKSQDLLSLALDISAGTGKDLGTVVSALQKAYLGNNQALIKLGVGLTKAELASGDFEAITAKLSKLFDGQAADAADGYAGQMNKLAIAADNAKEIIGKGILDALDLLKDNNAIGDLNTQMEDFAQTIADATTGLAALISKFNTSSVGGPLIDFMYWYITHVPTILAILKWLGKYAPPGELFFPTSGTGALAYAQEAEKAAKLAAKRLADEKKAAAAKDAAAKKAAASTAKLAKAAAMFDMEKIQLAAALKGKISAEEKLRLELQQAILNENDDLADKLQKKLEASQIATAKLAAEIVGIKAPPDPFAQTLETLKSIAEILGKMAGISINPSQNKDRNYDAAAAAAAAAVAAAAAAAGGAGGGAGAGAGGGGAGAGGTTSVPEIPSYVPSSFYDLENMFPVIPKTSSAASSSATITVNVNAGSVIMQDDLVTVINDGIIAAQKNGYTQLPNGAIVAP